MSQPLTKPPVNEMAVAGATLALVQEFLAGYFDGHRHDVGGNLQVTFPKAQLLFQQSGVTPPAVAGDNTLAITLVWGEPGRKTAAFENFSNVRQEMVQAEVTWNFWVRATGSNAKAEAQKCADLLHGLLGNTAATHPLTQRGIRRLRPREPRPIQETDYVLQLVTCGALLRYAKRSQTGTI